MRKNLSFCAGLVVGALLFGGTAAYAAGIIAERSTHKLFLNGAPVEAEAYVINGHNYFKLRDIAALVDFGVTWSGEAQAVLIDTMVGYTPDGSEAKTDTQTPASVESKDYSTEANQDIFSGAYTRNVYNAIRQTIADSETILGDAGAGYPYRSIAADESERVAMDEATAAIGNWPNYSRRTDRNGNSYCQVSYSTSYTEAAAYCEGFIDGLSGLSDTEKVREIACFVCDRLTYDAASTATPRTALTSDVVRPGNCVSYAHNFMFLCKLADIPCIFVHSEDHQWNQVYVEGQWWHVDLTGIDAGDNTSIRKHITVHQQESEMQGSTYIQTQPGLTAFVRELLVPGSTK